MKITIPFKNVASISDDGITKSILTVDVCNIPSNIPMECNPREQNMKSSVVKGIKSSLLKDDNLFYILNRGITLTAESISINNNKAVIEFIDTDTQGCIDGGHTLRTILQCQSLLHLNQQHVTVEVLTGNKITENFVKLAMSRNRSQQVQDYSLAELNKEFDWIKDIIANQHIDVIYRENDDGNVPISHIIWLLTMLNVRFYPDKSTGAGIRPNDALSNYIGYMNKYGLTKDNPYYAARDILIDILKLYDYVELNFGKRFKNITRLSCMKKGEFKTLMYQKKMNVKSPNQFLFPALSAFRAIIGVDNNLNLYWKTEPISFAKIILPELQEVLVQTYRDTKYTLDGCRSKATYKTLYERAYNKLVTIENEAIAERYRAMEAELAKLKAQQ